MLAARLKRPSYKSGMILGSCGPFGSNLQAKTQRFLALLRGSIADECLAGPYRLGVVSTAPVDHLRGFAPSVEPTITQGSSAHFYADLRAAVFVAPSFQLPKSQMTEMLDRQPFVKIPLRSVIQAVVSCERDCDASGISGWPKSCPRKGLGAIERLPRRPDYHQQTR